MTDQKKKDGEKKDGEKKPPERKDYQEDRRQKDAPSRPDGDPSRKGDVSDTFPPPKKPGDR